MSPLNTSRIAVSLALAGCLAAVLLLAGCGSRQSAGASAATTVRLGEYFYRPARVTVKVGQRVTFVNGGKIEHTVADSDSSGHIRARVIKPRPLKHGARQTVTMRRPGTVRYLCTFHPTLMKGVIRVVR